GGARLAFAVAVDGAARAFLDDALVREDTPPLEVEVAAKHELRRRTEGHAEANDVGVGLEEVDLRRRWGAGAELRVERAADARLAEARLRDVRRAEVERVGRLPVEAARRSEVEPRAGDVDAA